MELHNYLRQTGRLAHKPDTLRAVQSAFRVAYGDRMTVDELLMSPSESDRFCDCVRLRLQTDAPNYLILDLIDELDRSGVANDLEPTGPEPAPLRHGRATLTDKTGSLRTADEVRQAPA